MHDEDPHITTLVQALPINDAVKRIPTAALIKELRNRGHAHYCTSYEIYDSLFYPERPKELIEAIDKSLAKALGRYCQEQGYINYSSEARGPHTTMRSATMLVILPRDKRNDT